MIAEHFCLTQTNKSDDEGTRKEGLPEAEKLLWWEQYHKTRIILAVTLVLILSSSICTRIVTIKCARRWGWNKNDCPQPTQNVTNCYIQWWKNEQLGEELSQPMCFCDVCVEIIDGKQWGRLLWRLLDSRCSKSIIFKKILSSKRIKKLGTKDYVKYSTYGGSVVSRSTALVGLYLVELQLKENWLWSESRRDKQYQGFTI